MAERELSPPPFFMVVRVGEWNGFVTDEIVKLKGERGTFRFRAFVRNERNGDEYVELWGGPAGHEKGRSVHPDRVKRIHRRKRILAKPRTTSTGPRRCRKCGEALEPSGKVGRPRSTCPTC